MDVEKIGERFSTTREKDEEMEEVEQLEMEEGREEKKDWREMLRSVCLSVC